MARMPAKEPATKPRAKPPVDRKGPPPKWATVERKKRHPEVDAFIARYPKRTADAMRRLRALVHEEVEGTQEAIYWGVPFFFRNAPFCYISPAKKHITLGFTLGGEFQRSFPALKGSGKTTVLKASLHPGYALPEDEVRQWLREAGAADAKHAADDCGPP